MSNAVAKVLDFCKYMGRLKVKYLESIFANKALLALDFYYDHFLFLIPSIFPELDGL